MLLKPKVKLLPKKLLLFQTLMTLVRTMSKTMLVSEMRMNLGRAKSKKAIREEL